MRSISPISNITANFNGQEIGRLDAGEILTTIPNSNAEQLSSSPFDWQRIGTLNLEPYNIQPTRRIDLLELANYLEDYIKNRNQENVLFINQNTALRPIRYNNIEDLINFRDAIDEQIKEHFKK